MHCFVPVWWILHLFCWFLLWTKNLYNSKRLSSVTRGSSIRVENICIIDYCCVGHLVRHKTFTNKFRYNNALSYFVLRPESSRSSFQLSKCHQFNQNKNMFKNIWKNGKKNLEVRTSPLLTCQFLQSYLLLYFICSKKEKVTNIIVHNYVYFNVTMYFSCILLYFCRMVITSFWQCNQSVLRVLPSWNDCS